MSGSRKPMSSCTAGISASDASSSVADFCAGAGFESPSVASETGVVFGAHEAISAAAASNAENDAGFLKIGKIQGRSSMGGMGERVAGPV
jgi:hypothetical protein